MKQDAIYLEEINGRFQARCVIKRWMTVYNSKRTHSALDRLTPDDARWTGPEDLKAA
ncbi:integrase core domain-containing protein [Roseobacter cerasinus]|uniref:integrase core domain-containing protein n=1 Tax=Roseobacter cerasinus TaxID=2602289 RepID=UPI00135C14A4|nr:integrase core domain-containing protein [Roseobacter cerasinus]